MWIPPLAAIGVRLAVLAARPQAPETFEYDELARNLLGGRGYVLEHLGVPYRGYASGLVYTGLTTAFYALGAAGPEVLRLFQFVIAAATTLAVAVITARLGGSRHAAIAAGLLVGVHPALVYYDVRKLHPLGLDALLFAALIALLLSSRRASGWACVAGGILLGAGILERLTLVAVAPLALLGFAVDMPRRDRARRAAVFTGAMLLTVAPWLVRNHLVFGAPLASTMSAEYFFLGNVPPSQGSCLLPSGERVIDAAPPAFLDRLSAADERGQGRIFREASTEYVATQPIRFAFGLARKLVYFWTWAPQTGVLYPASYRRAYLVLYTALSLAALLGARRLWRLSPMSRRGLVWIAVACLGVSCLQAAFYVELRHRWALEPLLVVLAVFAVPAIFAIRSEAPAEHSAGTARRSDAGGPR